jgi:hypothetical protein
MKQTLVHSMLALLSLTFIFAGDEVLNQLRITRDQAQQHVERTIESGYLNYPSSVKQIAMNARATVVRGIGAFAKAYTRTEAFGRWYQEFRERNKPEPPELAKTAAENRRQLLADLRKQLADVEVEYKKSSGDMRQVYKQNIDMLKSMIAQQSQVNPEQDAMMDKFAKEANEQALQGHKEQLAQWEIEYPRDPKPFIKKRLHEFQEFSANVDFDAKLVPGEQGKMKFANPEYEQKDGRWKMCFRAGREATNAARSFVQEWLREL